MSGPDPSKTPPSAAGVLREPLDFAKFDADLTDLASRFAAQSGGGLSPELSAELALEIVLNEIVEQACLATGATGAAIVLERGGEKVCRASTGSNAPKMGARVDTSSGLSGECFRTGQTQWCDDAKSDPRVDAEASDRLGVRSVVVMPLLRGAEVVGAIELFSPQPYAFGVRDERTLEVLADRTLKNLEHAARPWERRSEPEPLAVTMPPPVPEPAPQPEPVVASEVEPEKNLELVQVPRPEEPHVPTLQARSFHVPYADRLQKDTLAALRELGAPGWALGASAVGAAVLLGLVLGWQWGAKNNAVEPYSDLNAPASSTPEPVATTAVTMPAPKPTNTAAPRAVAPAKPSGDQVPPGGLLVFENGKEVFRMPPTQGARVDQTVGVHPASSVEPERVTQLSPSAADGSLLQRVEPQYPDAARVQNIQGTVVLEAHIDRAGNVQDVQMVSGPPLLAQAAIDAVKQWKFKPHRVNGSPVEMQTRITLNFHLPR